MQGAILYGPHDVRVEERQDPRIIEPHRRDCSPDGDLYLRVGSVAVPGLSFGRAER